MLRELSNNFITILGDLDSGKDMMKAEGQVQQLDCDSDSVVCTPVHTPKLTIASKSKTTGSVLERKGMKDEGHVLDYDSVRLLLVYLLQDYASCHRQVHPSKDWFIHRF
jgi:hypothetical protein